MDFAKKQLEKYGWSEGRGLGKNEDGIATAIKPSLKFDNHGLGHDAGAEFANNWWDKLFNKAAQNIAVEVDNNKEVKIKTKTDKSVDFPENTNRGAYTAFIKTSKLRGSSVHRCNKVPRVSESPISFQSLTDEELFAACGGRTAHKGARHGLKCNGKLSRLEKQEKILLKKMRKVSLSDSEKDDNVTEKKLKKLKKQKENTEKFQTVDDFTQNASIVKKKKKPKKSVSFNETVMKIYPADLDGSFDSEINSMRDENSNEPNLENLGSGSDEGIGVDNGNENNPSDSHKSFETVQCKYSDLSKAEKKKLAKKRRLEGKLQTTAILQRLRAEYNKDSCTNDVEETDRNLKKRKLLDESEQGNSKQSCDVPDSFDRHRSKRNKKKRRKQRRMEEKQINNIVKSLDICSISKNA